MLIKKFNLLIIFTLIIISGCGKKFEYIIQENPVQPAISKEEALVYVIRPSFIGFMVPFKVYLDNKPIGLTKGRSYFYFYTIPGKHILKTVAGNTTELELDLEANKKYFVNQNIILDKIAPKNKTTLISPEEGEELIKKTKMLLYILKLPKGI